MSTTPNPRETAADRPEPIATDRLQSYRQPMVTSTGIILGFVLNFAASFVKSDSATPDWVAYAVFGLIIVGVSSLLVTLSRILVFGVTADQSVEWYQRTRQWFMIGVTSATGGAMLDMFSNFMSE